jgi:hypothetical protein
MHQEIMSLSVVDDEKDCRIHHYDKSLMFCVASEMLQAVSYTGEHPTIPLCKNCAFYLQSISQRRAGKYTANVLDFEIVKLNLHIFYGDE